MFDVEDCATLPYWFAHYCAFNMTALNLGVWRPRHLLHDIEKPFLMWLWKDHERVQAWHVKHSKHHYQGKKDKDVNWIDMMIDCECGRFTKSFAKMSAREWFEYRRSIGKLSDNRYKYINAALNKLGL